MWNQTLQQSQRPRSPDGIFPGTIWIPFLFLAIQTTRGLMFWLNLAMGRASTKIDAEQINIEGSPIDRVVLSILILFALFVMRNRKDRIVRFLRNNYSLILLITFMLLSVCWSDFRVIALKRCVRNFGLLIMVMLIFTEEHPLRYMQRLLEMLAMFLIFGSVFLVFFFPAIGTEIWSTGETQWLGLAVHKNMLGQYGALGSIFFLWRFFYVTSISQKLYYLSLLSVPLSALILFGSKSFTSVSVTIIGILVLVVLEISRSLGKLGAATTAMFIVALMVAALLIQNNVLEKPLASYFLQAGGKDVTFTGRTEIWNLALRDVDAKNLIVGSGYQTFWLTRKADAIRHLLSWEFYSAHNGYIDMFLQLGILGFGLFLAFLYSAIANVLKARKVNYEIFMLWSAFLLISIVSNAFESNFGVASDLYWFLTIVAGVSPKCFHADAIVPVTARAPAFQGIEIPNVPG